MNNRSGAILLLLASVLVLFPGRALLAASFSMPRSFEIFDTLIIAGSIGMIARNHTMLYGRDWLIALVLGLVIGTGMLMATLFSPYPFLGVVKSIQAQAVLRGSCTALATLGGLVVMRKGGPVALHLASGERQRGGWGALRGLLVGLPLALGNVLALQITESQPIQWQSPLAAMLDALQPSVVEECIYRFALWGLLWLLLRRHLAERAVWLTGGLVMLVHSYAHVDDLWLQSPVVALGMGAVLALVWGVAPCILARRVGLEAAVAFHWIQDVGRFVAGF